MPSSSASISSGSGEDCSDSSDEAQPERCGLIGWLQGLRKEFGHRLLILLFAFQHIVKGFVAALSGKANPYLYRMYHIPAQHMQILNVVIFSPYVLKPILGLTSDLFPVFGRNKAPYMFATTVFGVFACLVVGWPAETFSLQALVLWLFFVELMIAETDLLTEAVYARKVQESPIAGQGLLTFVFAGQSSLSLIATLLSGPLLGSLGPKVVYLLLAAFPALALLPLALGFLEEPRQSSEDVAAVRKHFWDQREACSLAFVMLLGSVSMSTCAILTGDPIANAATAGTVALVVLVSFTVVLSPAIAQFAAFTLLQTSFSLSVSGPSFYFMTDSPDEYPDGPHFSMVYYNTVLGSLSGIFSLLGLYTYNRFSSRFSYRSLLVASNFLFSLLHLCDAILFLRANRRVGIPDFAFVLGNHSLGSTVYQWLWMPQVALFSHLCPKGMEATMFALVVGCHNLGVGVASSGGSLLLHFLKCNPRGAINETAEFENLWLASVVSSLLPPITVLLIFRLVPDIRPGEQLVIDADMDGTTGSLWKRRVGKGKDAAE